VIARVLACGRAIRGRRITRRLLGLAGPMSRCSSANVLGGTGSPSGVRKPSRRSAAFLKWALPAAGAEEIDLRMATVLPGLVEGHNHMFKVGDHAGAGSDRFGPSGYCAWNAVFSAPRDDLGCRCQAVHRGRLRLS
jgi:hypothetical protein